MMDDASDLIDKSTRRARGAASNRSGRFEPHSRIRAHDGWDLPEDLPLVKTEVALEQARGILTRNTSPDLPFDRSINPYRGCEHGCVYCFARPSHAYLGLSPGLDFETKLTAKPNAAALLAAELSRKSYRPAPIAIGTNTDPYQPIEKKYEIMRAVLHVLRDFRHPVTVLTKGALIARDADILGAMGRDGLAVAGLSLTPLDAKLARAMEPRAAAPEKRLWAMRRLAAAGCPVFVSIGPVIPGLNDAEIETLLAAARDAGATRASYVMLRLPREVGPIFRDWLAETYPDRAKRIMGLVRQIHGGRDYDPDWGKRMKGEGIYADLIAQRFRLARARLGFATGPTALRTDLFHPPALGPEQLSLFPPDPPHPR